jgi:hypothetical protein
MDLISKTQLCIQLGSQAQLGNQNNLVSKCSRRLQPAPGAPLGRPYRVGRASVPAQRLIYGTADEHGFNADND